MVHLNVSSLAHNFDDLNVMISSLNIDLDIIGITETRIKKDCLPISNLEITDYSFESSPTESSAGGSGLYISNRHVYKRRSDIEMYKSGQLESTSIEIINSNSPNIILMCVYRHPCMALDEFNEDFLGPLLSSLSSEHHKLIYLMGDFNVDLLKIDEHIHSSLFLNALESHNLLPKILLPTRITPRSRTLIDNIFTNHTGTDLTSGNLTCSISDHLPQFLIAPIEKASIPKEHNIYIRNMKQFNKENFLYDLNNINWNTCIEAEHRDINHSFDNFISSFNSVLDRHAPLKKANKSELKLHQKPWITTGILRSIKMRNSIFRQFKKCKQQERKNTLYLRYKLYRNQIVSLTRLSKKNHMQKFFQENRTNARKTWQGIRSIINVKNTSRFVPNYITSNGKSCSDPVSIADNFNSYFSSVGKKIQNKIHSQHVNFSQYLNHPTVNSLFITPTNSEEITDIISSFKANKATGPNSIPNNILQMSRELISTPLSDLINLSFETGSFPMQLKLAKITPIHKKGSKLDIDNYRPISLLSNLNKIFEKIMHKRVYKFLTLYNSFFEMQFGFREKHSTSHALISLTETIRQALDDNKFACGIFIDLRKAFDTVDHDILLKKLEYYGIRGLSNEWFRSYLTDRKQFVSINGFNSRIISTNTGVPQGSVLGPLLFLIYINDMHVAIKNSLVHHFADDTNLLHINSSIKQLNRLLNNDLKSLCNWLKANKIALNVTKTELLFFRHPNKKVYEEPNLKIDGKKLLLSKSVKYLGVSIDEFL